MAEPNEKSHFARPTFASKFFSEQMLFGLSSLKIADIIQAMSYYGEELSERELDVLRSIARGASNKEVAAELYISENTVKVHLRRVFAKLGVASRTEATRVAIEQGLVILPGAELPTPATEVAVVEPEEPALETAVAQSTIPQEPITPTSAEAEQTTPQRPHSLWRTTSLVLGILLIIATISFISLRLWANDEMPVSQPFAEMDLGENWVHINRPLPVPLAEPAAATVGFNIYVIGGQTADTVINTLYSFDTVEHIWQQRTPKPTAVAAAAADELFGEIYVVGGRLANGQPTPIVEVYSPTQNAWRPVTSLPQPISSAVVVSDGSFLYLFGGWDGENYLDTAYVYDPAGDSWRPLPAMSQARAFATGQFMTNRLYVVGGYDGEQELATCEFFDSTLSRWSDCPPMLLARAGSASEVVLNKLYVIGGGLTADHEVIYSEQFDPAAQAWQVVNTPLLKETPSWNRLGVANVENRIFVFGGYHDQTLSANTYIYSPFVFRTFLPSVPVREK